MPRLILGFGCLALVAVLAAKGQFTLAGLVLVAATGLLVLLSPYRRLWAGGGMLYAGSFIEAICLLTADGATWRQTILWLFATVWGTDVCAYFGGRLLGGPKIWPRISPKKTWSGTLIGITCGAAIGTWVHFKFDIGAGSGLGFFSLSLATAAVSQGGDLFESWMKRRFNVKDSSHLIPGHGGFLDRLDGFVAAVVFMALFGVIFDGALFGL
jgi:phosphatidate cytidylyltransferase